MSGRRARPALEYAGRAALLAGSVLVALMALELGCRAWRGGWHALAQWPNLVAERVEEADDAQACTYISDPTLGWRPGPNTASAEYNVGPDGYRRTPPLPTLADPVVLVTGSSFAEGAEVSDDETWPFYLQAPLGRRVINAGVAAYSLDQIVLWTERTATLKPAVVVLSFTPSDVRRSELKVSWSKHKPYFALKNGELELQGVPVPSNAYRCGALPFWPRMLGWSVLIDVVAGRLDWQQAWLFDEVHALPPGSGEALACPIMRRLARVGVPTLVVAQYGRLSWEGKSADREVERRMARRALDCAAEAGLATLDLYDLLRHQYEARGLDALYREEHHSPDGNRLVADTIARELARRGLLTAAGSQ